MKSILFHYPFTVLCIIAIWILCLCNPPSVGLEEISNIDKCYHVIMYLGTCGVFWVEYWRGTRKGRVYTPHVLLLVAVVAPIVMSGCIELIQQYGTGGRRSGDWLDFAANSLGVLLAYLCGNTVLKRLFK